MSGKNKKSGLSPLGAVFSDRFERATISVALALVFLAVLSSDLLGLSLPASLATGAILAALFVIIRVTARLHHIEGDVNELIEAKRSSAAVRRFDTYPEFYRVLGSRLQEASVSLRLTHIRDHPPSSFKAGSDYFEGTESWAAEDPGRIVRRIIATNSSEMQAWADAQAAFESQVNNFHVRSCSWTAGFPMINMAIIDSTDVFLAISGETVEQTAGLWISDPDIVRYFIDYYENMWRNSGQIRPQPISTTSED